MELKQILYLKVGCSDFGPVRDRDSLPYCTSKLTVRISALFGKGAVYPMLPKTPYLTLLTLLLAGLWEAEGLMVPFSSSSYDLC